MKKKKLFLLPLVFALIFAILTSCTQNGSQNVDKSGADTSSSQSLPPSDEGREMVGSTYVTGLPIVKEKITLKVAVAVHPNDEYIDRYEDKPFIAKAEADTGIHIDWIPILESNASEQVTAMLAGGDMPDIFIGLIGDSILVQNARLFVPLNDMLDKYAPNVIQLYKKNSLEWESFLKMPDGKIYSLMGGYYTSYLHLTDSVQWINKTWLDKVGMKMPTTIDELYEVLKAFKEQDVNGNGDPNDEIPLNFANAQWAGGIKYMAGSWGIWDNYNLKNGKVLPSINTDNYREYLEFYNKLAKEGLLNREGFSQTAEQYFADISGLRSGIFLGWAPPTFMSDNEAILQYDPMPILAVPGKEDLRITHTGSKKKFNATRNAFLITSTCSKPEAALRWWDYLSSTQDMAMLVAWGEEGVGYTKLSNGTYQVRFPSKDELDSLGLTSPTALKASMGIINFHPLVLNNLSVDVEANPTLSDACRQRGIDAIYEFIPDEVIPRGLVPAEKQEELMLIQTDLMTLINSFRSDAILNGVTNEAWDAYLKQLKEYRYEEYLKWQQDYYDGAF